MNPADARSFNAQIYDEAAEWFVEFRTGDIDADTRRRFNAWLRTSPEHMRAYLELAAIWNEGSGLDPSHKFDGPEFTDDLDTNIVRLNDIKLPGIGGSGVSGLSHANAGGTKAAGLRPKSFLL